MLGIGRGDQIWTMCCTEQDAGSCNNVKSVILKENVHLAMVAAALGNRKPKTQTNNTQHFKSFLVVDLSDTHVEFSLCQTCSNEVQ